MSDHNLQEPCPHHTHCDNGLQTSETEDDVCLLLRLEWRQVPSQGLAGLLGPVSAQRRGNPDMPLGKGEFEGVGDTRADGGIYHHWHQTCRENLHFLLPVHDIFGPTHLARAKSIPEEEEENASSSAVMAAAGDPSDLSRLCVLGTAAIEQNKETITYNGALKTKCRPGQSSPVPSAGQTKGEGRP